MCWTLDIFFGAGYLLGGGFKYFSFVFNPTVAILAQDKKTIVPDLLPSLALLGSLRNFARRKMITFTEADGSDVTPAVRTQATDLFNGGDDPRPVLDQVIANRPEVVGKDKVRVHAPLLICEGAEEDVEVDQLKSANPVWDASYSQVFLRHPHQLGHCATSKENRAY